jgi:hypothetical protein
VVEETDFAKEFDGQGSAVKRIDIYKEEHRDRDW